MSKTSVFVTGGAGFIGRWLVKQSLERGWHVAVYDNFSYGKMDNVMAFVDDIELYEADILDGADLRAAMTETKPDVVFHLAALHFIPYCKEHPSETLRVNVEGTQRVLSEAERVGATRAVVASSGAFYPSLDEVLTEDIEPAPVDIYGLSKLLTEHVTEYVARTTGLSCVAARLFNTYGPYETNPHLIPHIMASLHRGPRIELGNIHTKRDYIYVEDVAHLLIACAEAALDGFTAVNIGTGVEYSAKEIVDVLSRLLGEPIDIQVDESRVRAVDKMHQRASTDMLEAFVGRGAETSLEEGLRRLLAYEEIFDPGE